MSNQSTTDLDALIRYHSAFSGMEDLLSKGTSATGYRPTLDVADPERLLIADAYDAAQAARGCPLRTYRYQGRDTILKLKRKAAAECRKIARYNRKIIQVREG